MYIILLCDIVVGEVLFMLWGLKMILYWGDMGILLLLVRVKVLLLFSILLRFLI